jgi:hypothetical protein
MDRRRNSRMRYVLEPSIRKRFGDRKNDGTENGRRNAHRVSCGWQAAKWPLEHHEGPQSG